MVVIAALLGVLLMVFLYQGGSEEPEAGAEPEAATRLPDSRETQSLTLSRDEGASDSPREPQQDPSSARDTPSLALDQAQPELLEAASSGDAEAPPSGEQQEEPEQIEPPSEPAPESKTAPSSLPEVPEDERVLLSWRSSEYTLQLLGASSRDSVESYISSQPNADELLVFESRRNGKPWFAVVVGRYDSTSAARSAISELPSAQREAGPWPRSLAEIQEEIEALRDVN